MEGKKNTQKGEKFLANISFHLFNLAPQESPERDSCEGSSLNILQMSNKQNKFKTRRFFGGFMVRIRRCITNNLGLILSIPRDNFLSGK